MSEDMKSKEFEKLQRLNHALEGMANQNFLEHGANGADPKDFNVQKLSGPAKEELIQELRSLNIQFNASLEDHYEANLLGKNNYHYNLTKGKYENADADSKASPRNDQSELNVSLGKKCRSGEEPIKRSYEKNLNTLNTDRREFFDDLEEIKKINELQKGNFHPPQNQKNYFTHKYCDGRKFNND
jgi:hypothetical protein